MNKAEEYFWENLSKHNLILKNTINRQNVDFDEIIKIMEQYADEVSQESNKKIAVEFIWIYSDISLSFTYKEIEELYDNWFKEQKGSAVKAEIKQMNKP